KLRSIAPMVLHGRLCGRVGRCEVSKKDSCNNYLFLFCIKNVITNFSEEYNNKFKFKNSLRF
ncbi:hypothetical protein, partial [Clostridium beijerinckii]|uniref:hypothetical protein n=1 Tax=Clostridium beijerinckii TaxID=1520 RepID=UPI0019802B52